MNYWLKCIKNEKKYQTGEKSSLIFFEYSCNNFNFAKNQGKKRKYSYIYYAIGQEPYDFHWL